MLTIGSRSKPSVLNLVLIVILIIATSDYVSTSLHSGDWTWSSIPFADSPAQVFQPAAPGLGIADRPLSGVDHFVGWLEDLHAWMNHVLGLEQSDPISGARMVASCERLREYRHDQNLCD